ncbi:unnamed protein product [Lactuca virosa]|uniref:SWIM-type domain-containing protein n=1 Tax=Lactuca virosa TaxID=75947 RepID=A0AAU9MNS8_9ASTR|nr:unnamed protein product [Lactuca virosa]
MVQVHTCTRSNKGGNKRATQGWIANVETDKLKSDGDVSPYELRNWIMKTYNVDVPYLKVFRGKEQAYTDMYVKWEDSFMKMDEFREELLKRNEGSVVEIDFDKVGGKKLFKRFFICLTACSRGFVVGCRPYIGLDACHLKGKFNGVLAVATETFNSWIGKLRYKPVLDLLDAIREKIKKRFDKKRNLVNTWNGVLVPIAKNHLNDIAKNLGEYEVTRSCENQAEVKYKGTRWEVNLDEIKCSCRVWQVQGRPCVHAAAFIAFIRDANWDKYVEPYFTIEKFKSAYAFQIALMPEQNQWAKKMGRKYIHLLSNAHLDDQEKIELNHRMSLKEDTSARDVVSMDIVKKTCKNPASESFDQSETATSKRKRGNNTKSHGDLGVSGST